MYILPFKSGIRVIVSRNIRTMNHMTKTGLLACITKPIQLLPEANMKCDLKCEVSPAPYILRPYAGLYNPFPESCSVLCNHPTRTGTKEFLKRAKDAWSVEGKLGYIPEEQQNGNRIPHDIVTEDMFRRYTETDSRPLTPAPTLASGKSRGSRRCLTPDQPPRRIVLDLRRSHSQETVCYHGHSTSDHDRSTQLSVLSDSAHQRLLQGPAEQLPSLAAPLVLAKRTPVTKETTAAAARKNQLRALNLGKGKSKPPRGAPPASQGSKGDTEPPGGSEGGLASVRDDGGSGESRRRGKRRRKTRAGSDRMTSAGLAAQVPQDPETQIAGITSDSHNPSSRGSVAAPIIDDVIAAPPKRLPRPKTDSFLDEDILKMLHREVDEDAIEAEFDTKRRYVLEEALRTRPCRPHPPELAALRRELRVPEVSLGDWLHIPRVFSRQNACFALPIDTNALTKLTPMQYAARYVTLKKSKQLLYLTVLRKFRPGAYSMPKQDIPEGLVLMMGGTVTQSQMSEFKAIMEWDTYEEEDHMADDIKLTLSERGYQRPGLCRPGSNGDGDTAELQRNSIKFRTWCGLCAICERMYGVFPPRTKDPPDGMEQSDFTMADIKLSGLQMHGGLTLVINAVRTR